MEATLRNLGVEMAGRSAASLPSESPLPPAATRASSAPYSSAVSAVAVARSPSAPFSPAAPSSATALARGVTGPSSLVNDQVPDAHPLALGAGSPSSAGTSPGSSASPGHRSPRAQLVSGFDRLVLDAVQDEEEGEEGTERRRSQARAAERQAEEHLATLPPASKTRSQRQRVAGIAAGPMRVTPAGAVEPAFEFAPLPSDAALASNKDKFVSKFMLQIVANWPQNLASSKRRRMNKREDDSPGAAPGAALGTNATLKTWATRIRVACSFADFIGRTVCWHPDDPRPSDEERDRGVRKFFRCLSPLTKRVIVAFLNSRKKGLAVAGGGKPLSAVSLKDFTNGLTFMFGEAKIDGPGGDQDLIIDCADRSASWKAKGEAELKAERALREDPGVFTGNPMNTTDLKNWRSATHKQARLDGEHSKSAAAVTPELMLSLHNELWLRHRPASDAAQGPEKSEASPAQAPLQQSADYTPPSDIDADHMAYALYVLAFISLARPATLLDLKFEDVTYPDLKLAENYEFFQRYAVPVMYCFFLRGLGLPVGRCAHHAVWVSAWRLMALLLTSPAAHVRSRHVPAFSLCDNLRLQLPSHQHHRFINLALRVVKTGTGTTDVLWIRLYSYFAEVTLAEEEKIGQTAFVHCNSEHLNFPQLFNSLMLFACSAPGVGVDASKLEKQYLFPSLLQRSVSGTAALFKKRSETEVNNRFVADLERIGRAYINGERACRMYGFRRGGAQALLNETGLFEQVMRLGGWRADSNSFLKYVTAMNSRGTLRSTLRSFRRDEVTQVVAQVMASYKEWTAGVVRDLCTRAIGEDGFVAADVVADIEKRHTNQICTIICECVLTLRSGSGALDDLQAADDDSSSGEDN